MCDILHTSYHKNNSIFERFKWFQKKKKDHLLHHRITCYNFNLFDNTSDKFMNKYKNNTNLKNPNRVLIK